MITRIEIDGFKSFQDFSVDLAPFQVIIGVNGCGKSNLFDVIGLLSRLANQSDLYAAFQDLRGQPFTLLPDGKPVDRIRIAVEMLVDQTVRDGWGDEAKLLNPRLRYNLEIVRRRNGDGFQDIRLQSESLWAISPEPDTWSRLHGGEEFHNWLHSNSPLASPMYINTAEDKLRQNPTIYLTPENAIDGRKPRDIGFQSGQMNRTLLSRIETTENPHILAVRHEMQTWATLHLNPDNLRLPSMLTTDGPFRVIGNSVPYVLANLEKAEPEQFRNVSRDLRNLLRGVRNVQVEFNVARNEYEVFVYMDDDRRFGLAGLSDGTLRLLALVTAKNAVNKRGLLCIEEPENAVHPGVHGGLVQLLRDMATDLRDSESLLQGGRQVLVTTHSPGLVSHLDMSANELLFADMATRIIPHQHSLQVTRMFPVQPGKAEGPEAMYGLQRVIEYLNIADVEAQRCNLKEAFSR